MIVILLNLLLFISYYITLQKFQKSTIKFIDKYYFTLKEAMKMIDSEKQRELLSKIKKEFGEY